MNFISIVFSIIGIGFCLYVAYNIFVRYLKIKDLSKEDLRESEKNSYLNTLRKYLKICAGIGIINILAFFSPWLEFRLIAAIGTIIILSNVFSDLLDEIADFDASKKDSDILLDYLKNAKEDSKNKAKENKIQKIDSLAISRKKNGEPENINVENKDNIENNDKK